MFELNLRGDEEIVINQYTNKLQEVRGVHVQDNDGKEYLANFVFYNAHIEDDGTINVNAAIVDGEKRYFDFTCT